MKKWLLISFFTLLPFTLQAQCPDRDVVKVGGYPWAPFVELKGRSYEGLTLELIDLANLVQGDFEFEFVLTTREEKHQDFYQGAFDVLFLEDVDWGWNAYQVEASKPLAKGTILYIALQKRAQYQRFFQDLDEKSLSALEGFAYSFAGYNANVAYLDEHFNIRLRERSDEIIKDVTNEVVEIGVIDSLFLESLFAKDNKFKNTIMVADKFDQDFNLSVLLRKDSAMSMGQMDIMLKRMEDEGLLEALWAKYQIDPGVE